MSFRIFNSVDLVVIVNTTTFDVEKFEKRGIWYSFNNLVAPILYSIYQRDPERPLVLDQPHTSFLDKNSVGFADDTALQTHLDGLFTVTKNWNIEVGLGNIPGKSFNRAIGRNPAVGTAFEDIWDSGGILDYPTSGEAWEVVSSSANDSSAGTGMRTLRVFYMDDSYVSQVETLTLNGTTPVSFVATDAFRHVLSEGLTWGSTEENEGNITIRRISDEAVRGQINLDSSVAGDVNGLNGTQDGHFTVPSGKTAQLSLLLTNATKDHDVTIRLYVRAFGIDEFRMAGEMGNYQNTFEERLDFVPIVFPEKTDIKMMARSNNTDVVVNTQMHFTISDN